MMLDEEMVRRYCHLETPAEALLLSSAAPIVLLPPKPEARPCFSAAFAPDNDLLGVMIPYTPLHLLLEGGGASAGDD